VYHKNHQENGNQGYPKKLRRLIGRENRKVSIHFKRASMFAFQGPTCAREEGNGTTFGRKNETSQTGNIHDLWWSHSHSASTCVRCYYLNVLKGDKTVIMEPEQSPMMVDGKPRVIIRSHQRARAIYAACRKQNTGYTCSKVLLRLLLLVL
jgi:hypothetical protein